MSFKPDYGLRLLQSGCAPDTDHIFYDFRLFSLAVLGEGQFSTMVEVPSEGEVLALSLDFNWEQLKKILSKAEPKIQETILKELFRDSSSRRRIDFDGEVSFGVRARIGEPIQVKKETFVPLIAQEIL